MLLMSPIRMDGPAILRTGLITGCTSTQPSMPLTSPFRVDEPVLMRQKSIRCGILAVVASKKVGSAVRSNASVPGRVAHGGQAETSITPAIVFDFIEQFRFDTVTDTKETIRSSPTGVEEWTNSDLDMMVATAIQGNRRSTERLLQLVQPLILRYCRARLGRQERSFAGADDVAQDVCLAVLTALANYRDQGRPFLAFLYDIAVQKVADAHRDARRHHTESVAGIPDERGSVESIEQSMTRDAQAIRLAKVRQVLSDKQWEILMLRVVVGLSAKETADAVGSTPGAVRVMQHKALARLRLTASQWDLV